MYRVCCTLVSLLLLCGSVESVRELGFLDDALQLLKDPVKKSGSPPREAAVDPECFMNTPQLIADNGFQSETHWVTTKDGYILQIFRIPPVKSEYNSTQTIPTVLFLMTI